MDCLFTFPNTHHVIKAETELQKNHILVRPMPLPTVFGDCCGICLRVKMEDAEAGSELLKEAGVQVAGRYKIELQDQTKSYIAWE